MEDYELTYKAKNQLGMTNTKLDSHYTEKLDQFFSKRKDELFESKNCYDLKLGEFQDHFYEFEEEYFASLPDGVRPAFNLIMNESGRFLYALSRHTR